MYCRNNLKSISKHQNLRSFQYIMSVFPYSFSHPGWGPAMAELQTNNYRRNEQSTSKTTRLKLNLQTNLNNKTAKIRQTNKQTTIGEMNRAKATETRPKLYLQKNLSNKTHTNAHHTPTRHTDQPKRNTQQTQTGAQIVIK